VLVVHETTSELEQAILTIMLFAGAENTDSYEIQLVFFHRVKHKSWFSLVSQTMKDICANTINYHAMI
jgi:hypothetical protein